MEIDYINKVKYKAIYFKYKNKNKREPKSKNKYNKYNKYDIDTLKKVYIEVIELFYKTTANKILIQNIDYCIDYKTNYMIMIASVYNKLLEINAYDKICNIDNIFLDDYGTDNKSLDGILNKSFKIYEKNEKLVYVEQYVSQKHI